MKVPKSRPYLCVGNSNIWFVLYSRLTHLEKVIKVKTKTLTQVGQGSVTSSRCRAFIHSHAYVSFITIAKQTLQACTGVAPPFHHETVMFGKISAFENTDLILRLDISEFEI